MLLKTKQQVSNLDNQLQQAKSQKATCQRQLEIAKSPAVSKVGSTHEVETAMFAGKLPRQAKVFKRPKHVSTTILSDNDASDAEFAGVAFAIENNNEDNYPSIIAADVVTFKDQAQAESVVKVPKKVPQSTKLHRSKMKSVVRIDKIRTTTNNRKPAPFKSQLLDERWESEPVDSQSSTDFSGEAAFFRYDYDEEVRAPSAILLINKSGTSLHLAIHQVEWRW